MTCPRCGTKTDSWPCPECGFPVVRYNKKILQNRFHFFLTGNEDEC